MDAAEMCSENAQKNEIFYQTVEAFKRAKWAEIGQEWSRGGLQKGRDRCGAIQGTLGPGLRCKFTKKNRKDIHSPRLICKEERFFLFRSQVPKGCAQCAQL